MGDLKLDGSQERTAYLLDKIPQTRNNYLYLILCYWQVFDGIDIPEDIVRQIADRGTQPETISRSRRKVMEQFRVKQYLELQRMAKEVEQVEAPNKH